MSTKEPDANSSNFEMVLHSAMGLPGVKINRADFLRKELSKYYDVDTVNKAIDTNPAQADISVESLEKIAKSCINYETRRVAALSAAAGVAGVKAMVVTVPADTAQFFGHIIRILQKLVYLYGWQEMLNEGFDDETSNQLTLFIGVMFGVSAANGALSKVAALAALNVPKKLTQQALTKGTIYPIVKAIAAKIGVRMTKVIFAQGVGKVIPVIGAVASGGITFALFKPMSIRLKNYLATLPMASADFYKKPRSGEDIIDIDFTDIVIEDIEGMDDFDEL